jgi:CHAD domain-containing protein
VTRLADAARRVRRRADADAVHDVRVAARQIEAALDLWQVGSRRRPVRRARRALRKLRRSLGRAREAHASLVLLNEHWEELPSAARIVAEQVLATMQGRVERLDRRAAEVCTRRTVDRILRRVDRAWPDAGVWAGAGHAWLERAGTQTELRRERAEGALGGAREDASDDALHETRVAVKRWRYSVERLAAVAPDGRDSGRRWLKDVQNALGRIQDVRVLRERILRSVAGLDPPRLGDVLPGLPSLLAHLDAERSARVEEFRRMTAATSADDSVLEFPALTPVSSRTRS